MQLSILALAAAAGLVAADVQFVSVYAGPNGTGASASVYTTGCTDFPYPLAQTQSVKSSGKCTWYTGAKCSALEFKTTGGVQPVASYAWTVYSVNCDL